MKEATRPKKKAKFTYDFEGNLVEINMKLKSNENPVQITKIRLKTQESTEKKKDTRRIQMRSTRVKKGSSKKQNNFFKKQRLSFLKDGKKQTR